ncbi:MAG: hypothetical protein N2C14_05725 [Planctomycetales bacterium]
MLDGNTRHSLTAQELSDAKQRRWRHGDQDDDASIRGAPCIVLDEPVEQVVQNSA